MGLVRSASKAINAAINAAMNCIAMHKCTEMHSEPAI